MYGQMMAGMGTMLLLALGIGGCMSQVDAPVTAMVRANDLRAQASDVRVSIDLQEIVNP